MLRLQDLHIRDVTASLKVCTCSVLPAASSHRTSVHDPNIHLRSAQTRSLYARRSPAVHQHGVTQACSLQLVSTRAYTRIYPRIPAHTRACSRILGHTRAYSRILAHTRAYPRILAHTSAYRAYSRILGHTRAYSRILAHTRAYPRILAHTRAYSRILAHTRACPRILAHTSAYPRVLAHTRAHSRILAHTRAYSRIPAHTRAYPRIPAHTRAYPRIPAHTRAYSRIPAHTRPSPSPMPAVALSRHSGTSHPCHPPPTPATHLPPATHALAAAGGRNKRLMFCPPCASLLEKLVVMSCCRGELRGWMALRRSSQTPVAVQPCQALYHLLYWALGLGRTIAT